MQYKIKQICIEHQKYHVKITKNMKSLLQENFWWYRTLCHNHKHYMYEQYGLQNCHQHHEVTFTTCFWWYKSFDTFGVIFYVMMLVWCMFRLCLASTCCNFGFLRWVLLRTFIWCIMILSIICVMLRMYCVIYHDHHQYHSTTP